MRLRLPEAQVLNAGSALMGADADAAEVQAVKAQILAALRSVPGVTQVDEAKSEEAVDEETVLFRLYAEDTAGLISSVSQALAESGAEVRDLHVKKPSLEDVFIYLTGRNLR